MYEKRLREAGYFSLKLARTNNRGDGNSKVGCIVMATAAKNLTPVALELGGKSPVVIDPNVKLKVAIKRIVVGKWGLNNGQACIAPDYIITTKSLAPEVIAAMKVTLEEFYGEDPLESKDISCIVNSNHFKRLERLLDDDMVSGKIIYGGQRDEKRLKIAPTLLVDVPHNASIMNEEIFGPLLPIVLVDKVEECFDFINSRPKPLAAYLFTKDKNLEKKFVDYISAGGMLINDIALHIGNSNLPFGGVGESGMGSYHGKFSFDCFSHKKGVLSRSFGGEVGARGTPQDLFLVMGALYATCLFLGVNNSSSVQPVVSIERTVYYRERATKMYSSFPYAAAQGLVEIPYIAVRTIIFGIITYFMVNYERTIAKFILYLVFMFLTFTYFTFFGMMAVGLTP